MSSHSPLSNTTGYEYVKQQANIEISLPEPGIQYVNILQVILFVLLEYSVITDLPVPTNTTGNKSQNGGITDTLYVVPSLQFTLLLPLLDLILRSLLLFPYHLMILVLM